MLWHKVQGAGGLGEADPYFSNVSLLLHGDGTNGSTTFIDSSSNNFTVTANGNAQIDTTVVKYGTGSMQFDGSGDYLDLPSSSEFAFGTGAFTVEFWTYFNASFGTVIHGTTNTAFTFGVDFFTTGVFAYTVGGSAVSWPAYSATGVWAHHAFVRSGSTLTWYLNGVSQGGRTFTLNVTATGALRIGARANLGGPVNGYVDDMRMTKGIARYTSNFTPPTAAFPNR